MIETHPFGQFVPTGARCLILGTFPTHAKNWRFNSFYPGRANFFWRMLSEIYKHPFKHTHGDEAGKERLALCAKYGIAISDTAYRVKRLVHESSLDSNLEVVERMDVLKILKDNPSINTVILTGSSGKVSAHAVFYQHLEEFNIPFALTAGKPPILGNFELGGRQIKVCTLYSTSGINIGRYKEAVEQYRKYLPAKK
jgi:G:T/U-mismatch repair DNA glycosylase